MNTAYIVKLCNGVWLSERSDGIMFGVVEKAQAKYYSYTEARKALARARRCSLYPNAEIIDTTSEAK